MKRIKNLMPYLIGLLVLFYLLPLLNYLSDGICMLLLLVIMPITVFCASVFYGVENSFDLFLSIATAILFAPTIFIFYNPSAAIYIFAYFGISLVGNFLGVVIRKPSLEKKNDDK